MSNVMTASDVQARLASLQARLVPGALAVGGRGGILGSKASETESAFADALARAKGETSASASGRVSGDDVVKTASKHLGAKYVWGGESYEEGGFDCSGLVQATYAELGITLPRVARDQAKQGVEISSIEQAKPGDLIAFGSPVNHIGIYVGEGKYLHAPKRGDVVKISDLGSRKIATIRRILPDGGAVSGASATSASLDRLSKLGPPTSASAQELIAKLGVPAELAQLFADTGARYELDPFLLASVAKAESGFNIDARSHAGALGMMQLMPKTAEALGADPMDPASALDAAARLLGGQKERFGSWDLAIAAYNAGGPAVARHGGIPPYKETQGYVRRVMDLWESSRA